MDRDAAHRRFWRVGLHRLRRSTAMFGLAAGLAFAAGTSADPEYVFGNGFEGDPPVVQLRSEDAARFLAQATFGPSLPEIERLRTLGLSAWLSEQFSLPVSRQLPFLDGLIQDAIDAGQPIEVWQHHRQEIWWRNALYGQDQLRQRVAFALSQILVISDQNGALEGNPTTVAHFYDLLAQRAFGNYRDLLEDVTLHPAMGHFLSMIRNRKPDPTLNIRPDENFAREIMQLFSVGLVMLEPDGTPVDGDPTAPGIQPVPTYDQDTIRGFAHVFTGWNYSTCDPIEPRNNSEGFNWWAWQWCPSGASGVDWRIQEGWRTPMEPWGEGTALGAVYHASEGDKQLLDYPGVALRNGVLPAGGTARANLAAALDNVFEHPNVGPFLARRLIQRLTTSNPSPGYVARVAAAFDDNGRGVRGDLRAVVTAILFDGEARQAPPPGSAFGKLREPLLRVTHLWRALDASSTDGRIREGWPEQYGAQAAQRSPTVFNFFLPDYQLPGEVANAGLYSPEFQITTDTFLIRMTNAIGGKVFYAWQGNPWLGDWDPVQVALDREFDLADDPDALVDHLDLLFLSGQMSQGMKDLLVAHLESIQEGSWEWRRQRVQDVLWLILTSPEYVVQK